MRPIGSGQQDVDHLGVATGRGVFNLSSSSAVGNEENPPLMEAALYFAYLSNGINLFKNVQP
jgi:hypothetical protein